MSPPNRTWLTPIVWKPMPRERKPHYKGGRDPKVDAKMAAEIKALHGKMTVVEIAKLYGLHRDTVRKYF